jgi:hypothetical protein
MVLNISAQNAGLILRRKGENFLFESWEVSPRTADVIGTTGRLICQYPGPVIAVDAKKVKDPSFLDNLASFLESMDVHIQNEAMPVSKKAGLEPVETRDTASPVFITEMLTGILHGIGQEVDNVTRFQKKIRDDVIYGNDKDPWRRSPLYLVLRVAMQSTLWNGKDHGIYKAFMVWFMADILELALQKGEGSDILFVMNAKLGRRACKAKNLSDFIIRRASDVMKRVQKELDNRWENIRANDLPSREWNPGRVSFKNDTKMSLKNSREYFEKVINRGITNKSGDSFQPHELERLSVLNVRLPTLSAESRNSFDVYLLLEDFENWVENSLDGWIQENVNHKASSQEASCREIRGKPGWIQKNFNREASSREASCREIGGLIEKYMKIGGSSYVDSPENQTIMWLTVIELWVALDKLNLSIYPLMKEYSPELPLNFLELLLLPKKSQMDRLFKIEEYLKSRYTCMDRSNPRILSGEATPRTFAVRYYNSSELHQNLNTRIETYATEKRTQKEKECLQRNTQFREYCSQKNRMDCMFITFWSKYGGTHQKHDWNCEKCRLESLATGMRINIQEWPLPDDECQKKVVLFELDCPLGYITWREITYKILHPQCITKESCQKNFLLKEYSELNYFYVDHGQQLGLSSSTKSWLKTHYNGLSFPVNISDVCLKNGMNYRLFDYQKEDWACSESGCFDIREMCTFKLPEGPYKNMQTWTANTIHTSNEVIADQHKCSAQISLHEFDAFGVLRSGHRLQWLNIARELQTRNLTWRNEAVGILIMQAVWQAGPGGINSYRESHVDPETPDFPNTLLTGVSQMWEDIKENWCERICAHSLIVLTSRILSLCPFPEINMRAIGLLREARGVTSGWMRKLSGINAPDVLPSGPSGDINAPDVLPSSPSGDIDAPDVFQSSPSGDINASDVLRTRLFEIAAVCLASYDVDRDVLDSLLDPGSPEDVDVAVECLIILNDNMPVKGAVLSPFQRSLLDRCRRLSWTIENRLKRLIVSDTSCEPLDACIKREWPAFLPGNRWNVLDSPNDRWIVTHSENREIHLNILTGRLLVCGQPLRRLPIEYTDHPTYFRTFGQVRAINITL